MSGMAKPETRSRFATLWPLSCKIDITSYSVDDHRICTKFGRLMQKHMPTAVKRSTFKPEVEFQYGDRLLLGSGSSNISAVR